MSRAAGRPPKAKRLDEYLEIRVQSLEKQAFRDAAELAGIPLATWIRERLRQVAIRELEAAGQQIAFLRYERSEQ
jgi:predicted HicB family RNase H-like nuclease